MKTSRFYIVATIIGFLFSSCHNVIDPYEPLSSFSIDNESSDTIHLVYTYNQVPDIGSFSGSTKKEVIAPRQKTEFAAWTSGRPDFSPKYLFERMVFLSSSNDTLLKMDVIDDSEWILVDSVADYGYKVGYCYWIYTFIR